MKYRDVLEVCTAYIIRVLMMEAVRTSKTSVYFNEATGAVSQEAVIFILAAVRT
jgi:hypothetical protein